MTLLEGGLQKELRHRRIAISYCYNECTIITTVCSKIKQPGNKREISIREASLVVFYVFVFCGACLFNFNFFYFFAHSSVAPVEQIGLF